ncbi:MAG TPA: hypothetical protein VMG10_06360 [Gemmataceae bacterium]|nr:hypothetical protein [Gemmataceae bacterium]
MHSQVVCPEQKTLKELVDGALANELETQLTDHLSACGRCQQILESLTIDTALDVGRQFKTGRDSWDLFEGLHECRLTAKDLGKHSEVPDKTTAP